MKNIKLSKSELKIFLCIFLIILSINYAGTFNYILLLSIVLIWLIKASNKYLKNKNIDKIVIWLIMPHILYILYTLIISLLSSEYEYYRYFIKQIIFVILPIFAAYGVVDLSINRKVNLPYTMFISITALFIYKNMYRIGNIFDLNSSLFEGVEGFIFGIFLIYYVYKNNFILSIVSFILMYLGHKRIAVFASIIVIIIYKISTIMKNNKNKTYSISIYILLISVSLIFIWMVSTDSIEYLFRTFNINTMGRSEIYSFINDYYDFNVNFYGNGMGFTEFILSSLGMIHFRNLHSDILKLYIELGFIVYIIYMLSYIKIYKNIYRLTPNVAKLYMYLHIFTVINLFTDNIMIYMYYLFSLYMIVIYEFKITKNYIIK